MGDNALSIPSYIDSIIGFPDDTSYELLGLLATYRSCHDGTPAEARIVLTCTRKGQDASTVGEYVVKIKIQ